MFKLEKTYPLETAKRSLHGRCVGFRPKERYINLRETRIRRPGESFYSRRKRVQHVHTDDRFRLEPNRIEEEVPRVSRGTSSRKRTSPYPVGTTSKNEPFFAFLEAVPLNPLILSVGAIGVMKEIGHASGKLEREVKLPFASGSRCKISIPVDVTREKRTNLSFERERTGAR